MSIWYEIEEERGCWIARFEDGITIGASVELGADPVFFDRLVRAAHEDLVEDGALDWPGADA